MMGTIRFLNVGCFSSEVTFLGGEKKNKFKKQTNKKMT